jgi:hypothetical protein
MDSRVCLLAVAACHAAPVRAPAPVHAQLHADASVCVDASALDAAVARVLAEHGADNSGLVVELHASATETGFGVSLRVKNHGGEVGLDRQYALTASDCASAVPLLALAVDRWLTAFPEWAEPPPPPPLRAARWYAVALEGSAGASAPPLGLDGTLGAVLDWGGARDRVGAALVARTGVPQDAGAGRVRVITALAAATWRHRVGVWEMRAELRGGALRANGLGFSSDHSDWLPWWEIAVFGGRRLSWGAVGLELATSANRDRAVTTEGVVSVALPYVHVGISGTFGLFGE